MLLILPGAAVLFFPCDIEPRIGEILVKSVDVHELRMEIGIVCLEVVEAYRRLGIIYELPVSIPFPFMRRFRIKSRFLLYVNM